MRCYPRKALTYTAALISLIVLLYVSVYSPSTETSAPASGLLRNYGEVQIWARELVSQQFHSERNLQIFHHLQNDMVPFNTSYEFLAGFPAASQKYLTVGLSSVKRKQGFYLLDTLHSIFTESSQEELEEMVVVVLLADFDMDWNERMLKVISEKFSDPVLKGQLLITHLGQKHYPPLEGLKRNFNDPPDRVYFRSKQNVDYAFLLSISANLSRYYLMLEDDVVCARNFLTSIKKFIQSQGNSPWVTMEFSKLGYIGKLYHSSSLPQLASFLYLFYQEMPCDWLLGHFSKLLVQVKPIRFKPSLFQHMGLYSSFKGTLNRLKDEDFEQDPENVSDNPPADVFTDITPFKEFTAKKAYDLGTSFFWGKNPSAGNHFTLVFRSPVAPKRILIRTGAPDSKKDILVSADVEVGSDPVRTDKVPRCSKYFKLGSLVDGQFEKKDFEKDVASALSCLRILVSQSQEQWVIIHKIQIWT
ncbi:alpha-1,3-mannosyl-glycoprotein 4-beta-N-acetylglucosaminyltransferase C-like isoform X2 [Brienomyrus brachyistius]|nr:alpha-1,3-mannosyl-glycoprotein 4-beta-N-acetylglucosaminyltransferase C-like isoform X2 [Brienomyrus brachyistius]XP_048840130.1 alpha-1,3-mannosyl-glycoprotein 4-beta-N-acetylglucosaminyltransferase C-like isoform X2 [Brienomyrus brachyistius]XP_048840131.1 alpha-1,3-mannosyl-glycoprotein 4-beta-N-acetylglucosaminyltransferase C-like isoform X2 [Brienomyrus brachyistius]